MQVENIIIDICSINFRYFINLYIILAIIELADDTIYVMIPKGNYVNYSTQTNACVHVIS